MTRIIALSDTHEQHNKIVIPPCDILIHSGDFTYEGDWFATRDFCQWFAAQPATHKIFIAGNHELKFDKPGCSAKCHIDATEDIDYLEDSGIEVMGLKIWGTPWQPNFYDWSFNGTDIPADTPNSSSKGPNLDKIYNQIPIGIDILISHGPPYGILDQNEEGLNCGSKMLLKHIERVKPKAVCFGHIHENAGQIVSEQGVRYINASSLNRRYKLYKNPITEIEI